MAGIKLPFVVEPKKPLGSVKIGDEDSGVLEIPIKGYLTSGEKSFIQQALSGDDGTLKMIALSRKVSNDKEITLDEAYGRVTDLLGGANDPDSRNLQAEYNEELSEILSTLTLMQDREKLVAATVILRYRINPKIDFDYIMAELHPTLVDKLYEIYQAESVGDSSILQSMAEESAEEKKPLTVNEIEKKPSRRRKANTGMD